MIFWIIFSTEDYLKIIDLDSRILREITEQKNIIYEARCKIIY